MLVTHFSANKLCVLKNILHKYTNSILNGNTACFNIEKQSVVWKHNVLTNLYSMESEGEGLFRYHAVTRCKNPQQQ